MADFLTIQAQGFLAMTKKKAVRLKSERPWADSRSRSHPTNKTNQRRTSLRRRNATTAANAKPASAMVAGSGTELRPTL